MLAASVVIGRTPTLVVSKPHSAGFRDVLVSTLLIEQGDGGDIDCL